MHPVPMENVFVAPKPDATGHQVFVCRGLKRTPTGASKDELAYIVKHMPAVGRMLDASKKPKRKPAAKKSAKTPAKATGNGKGKKKS